MRTTLTAILLVALVYPSALLSGWTGDDEHVRTTARCFGPSYHDSGQTYEQRTALIQHRLSNWRSGEGNYYRTTSWTPVKHLDFSSDGGETWYQVTLPRYFVSVGLGVRDEETGDMVWHDAKWHEHWVPERYSQLDRDPNELSRLYHAVTFAVFSFDNPEVMVKILSPQGSDHTEGYDAVYAASATEQPVVIQIYDRRTGYVYEWNSGKFEKAGPLASARVLERSPEVDCWGRPVLPEHGA